MKPQGESEQKFPSLQTIAIQWKQMSMPKGTADWTEVSLLQDIDASDNNFIFIFTYPAGSALSGFVNYSISTV